MDDVKGILLWVGLLAIFAIVFFLSQRMKKQIEEDGKEIEGILSNPSKDLQEGQEVRIKYHPKFKNNARLINENRN